MKLYEILIPTTDNNFKLFPLAHHREWDKWICKNLTGFYFIKYNKRQVDESNIVVRVAADSDTALKGILKFTASHYNQEAVVAYEVSSNVIIYKS